MVNTNLMKQRTYVYSEVNKVVGEALNEARRHNRKLSKEQLGRIRKGAFNKAWKEAKIKYPKENK